MFVFWKYTKVLHYNVVDPPINWDLTHWNKCLVYSGVKSLVRNFTMDICCTANIFWVALLIIYEY